MQPRSFRVGRSLKIRYFAQRQQGSSVVEQGTHKPLVESTLPPGSLREMAWVYILRGSSGHHYIGSAVDLDARV